LPAVSEESLEKNLPAGRQRYKTWGSRFELTTSHLINGSRQAVDRTSGAKALDFHISERRG
jgi:hypothetical protein